MERSIFAGGTAPGSPSSQSEIKTLICYLLAETKKPINFQQLHETLRKNDLVNYFELTENLNSLIQSEHIEKTVQDNINFYTATSLGRKAANTLDSSLTATVRQKSLETIKLIIARQKRLTELKAEVLPLASGGYSLELSIPEQENNLITFSVFAPTKEEALNLKINFLNDPIFIYKSVMALLSGDKKILGSSSPEKNALFDSSNLTI